MRQTDLYPYQSNRRAQAAVKHRAYTLEGWVGKQIARTVLETERMLRTCLIHPKRLVGVMDGVRSQIDASSRHTDVPSAQTDANKSAKAPEIVSTPQQTPKLADIPIENGPQKSQTSSGSARTGRPLATRETAVNGTEHVKRAQKRQTHRFRMKSQCPDLLIDGEGLPQVISKYTHRGTRQSRRWRP